MAAPVPLKTRLTVLFSFALFLLAVIILTNKRNTDTTLKDQCLSCHKNERDMSASHPNKDFGCASCHLGNPYAAQKDAAHKGIVRNPSDLQWADKTCGQAACHSDLVFKVRNSIMTSNAGIAASTLYQWHEKSSPDDSLLNIDELPDTSLATSHLRKMCAGCHVNKRENDFPGEIGERGGGCNDCHLQKSDNAEKHPVFSVKLDISVCEKCHNRSDRIGLTYQGKFESEGYGTPYEQGNTSSKELSGGRYYYHITADVHYEAGMVCIDCHIAEDIMGNGKRYAHLENQVHIQCEDCHNMQTGKPADDNIIWKILRANDNLKISDDSLFARTESGYFYANAYIQNGKPVLQRKLDGKVLNIPSLNPLQCSAGVHKRMSCQSCHSAYTPQCYGCHDIFDPSKKQMDKVSYEETYGHWREGRSWIRYEKPTLGVFKNKIMPFAPGCQVYLTELDDRKKIKRQETWLTMAAFDPHSTRKATAACEDCHSDPKRFGFGEGVIKQTGEAFTVNPVYDAQKSGLGKYNLDVMITPRGTIPQKMSRLDARPFSLSEIKKIYRTSYCIVCHDNMEDKIYKDYNKSLRDYNENKSLPCNKINKR